MPTAATASTPRVIVGMSGGVDSSVAARLLIDAGHAVEGLFMKNWEEDDGSEYCTARADLADARAVCERLGIRLHTANFAAEYWDNVFAEFLEEYRAGRTPNPDVLCNREIKFKAFLEYAEVLGADAIATGHYVRTRTTDGRTELLRGRDPGKDQSYFLHAVPGAGLARALFPLGDLMKSEVRRLAADWGFANHAKKDSTGICFIGERRFRDFLARYIHAEPGPLVSVEGVTLGAHQGLAYYTQGQRQGLGIGGVRGAVDAPWYVVDKDLDANTLIVAQGDHPALAHDWLECSRPSWVSHAPALPWRGTARIRYRQADQPCRLTRRADGSLLVRFDTPQRAITPGQSVCFYADEVCLGGGVITARGREPASRVAA